MNPTAAQYGLPARETLTEYRIWDSYFTPSHSNPGADGSELIMADIERSMPAIKMGGFERLCTFPHVGLGTTTHADFEKAARRDQAPRLFADPMNGVRLRPNSSFLHPEH